MNHNKFRNKKDEINIGILLPRPLLITSGIKERYPIVLDFNILAKIKKLVMKVFVFF